MASRLDGLAVIADRLEKVDLHFLVEVLRLLVFGQGPGCHEGGGVEHRVEHSCLENSPIIHELLPKLELDLARGLAHRNHAGAYPGEEWLSRHDLLGSVAEPLGTNPVKERHGVT